MAVRKIIGSAGSAKLMIVMITLWSGLTACATAPQTSQEQTSSSGKSTVEPSQSMEHNGMSHGSMTEMEHSIPMNLGAADTEYDLRFIDAMIPHHQGAVAMAQEALQKSKRPEIQNLANGIIKAQDTEIVQMKQWRKAWYPNASPEAVAYDAKTAQSKAMTQAQLNSMMMSVDLGAADSQFDLRFINAMIPHHEGAIVMAKDALNKSKRADLQGLAKNIIASQQAEIAQMKQWRKSWYQQ